MTFMDETLPSPPRSPSPSSSSPEHLQLEKINTAVDATLSDFSSLQQRVLSFLTHVVGLRWYQHACQNKISYQQWKDMTKQASQLTYAVTGTDEALMRHLFSLDAIMGDDDIRVLRRACVHRIKHAITQVERCTSYMYKIQYWIKKRIQHEEGEEEEDDTRMETDETNSKPVSPSSSPIPAPQSPSSARVSMSPPMRSSTLHPPVTKTRSNSMPAHHAPIKTSRSFTSSPVLKGKKGPTTQGKTTTTTTTTSTPTSPNMTIKGKKLGAKSPAMNKSPTLTAKAASPISSPNKSAPASPQLPNRHIPTHASKPVAPTSPRFSVSHDSTHITITALLPGVVRDSLEVTVRGHLLRIVGICQGENFVREMELPETCDVDQMEAAWEEQNDTLKIRVPVAKKQTQPQPQTRQQPSQQQQPRYVKGQHMEDKDGDDMDVSHPYYSHKPMTYPSRCAPSYVRPSYPLYGRRSVYAAPPRSMFGSSRLGGFW